MFVGERANSPARDKFAAEHSVVFGQFSRRHCGIDGQLDNASLECRRAPGELEYDRLYEWYAAVRTKRVAAAASQS